MEVATVISVGITFGRFSVFSQIGNLAVHRYHTVCTSTYTVVLACAVHGLFTDCYKTRCTCVRVFIPMYDKPVLYRSVVVMQDIQLMMCPHYLH